MKRKQMYIMKYFAIWNLNILRVCDVLLTTRLRSRPGRPDRIILRSGWTGEGGVFERNCLRERNRLRSRPGRPIVFCIILRSGEGGCLRTKHFAFRGLNILTSC